MTNGERIPESTFEPFPAAPIGCVRSAFKAKRCDATGRQRASEPLTGCSFARPMPAAGLAGPKAARLLTCKARLYKPMGEALADAQARANIADPALPMRCLGRRLPDVLRPWAGQHASAQVRTGQLADR
jgi:hypothetical protein